MAAGRHTPLTSPKGGGGDAAHHRRHQLRLAGLFLAITGCFLVYSLIQERLMTLGFGPQHERFEYSLFIILVNRLVCCAVAAAALSLAGSTLQPTAPLALFSVPSLANVLGSASQYEALKYVSFPLQALAKCAKTVGS
jgi:adenosine 3'-phospho 5'-phosphosulfate transporter B2